MLLESFKNQFLPNRSYTAHDQMIKIYMTTMILIIIEKVFTIWMRLFPWHSLIKTHMTSKTLHQSIQRNSQTGDAIQLLSIITLLNILRHLLFIFILKKEHYSINLTSLSANSKCPSILSVNKCVSILIMLLCQIFL